MPFTIVEDNIEFGSVVMLNSVANSGQNAQCLLLDISRVLIAHTIYTSSDNPLYGIVYDSKIEKLVQKIKNKQGAIAGIAKTNAEDGQLAEIITPIFEEVI